MVGVLGLWLKMGCGDGLVWAMVAWYFYGLNKTAACALKSFFMIFKAQMQQIMCQFLAVYLSVLTYKLSYAL